jgi:Sulfotransferase family
MNNPNHTPNRTTWLHVHVPKAGGSTLRQLMNRNFGKGYYNSSSLLETKQYTFDDVSEIVRCHPNVVCFSDHKLSLDLPYFHEHSIVRAICYVRDPVERFISRYFFHRHFEEVSCIAQRMTFRDFANAELVEQFAHPQTNSQIYFLNGGHSYEDMTIIQHAIATGNCYLFPIERFDESCVLLEKLFPEFFSDLSYVRANVSKKDATIDDDDRAFVTRYLKKDYPLFELANRQLDLMLQRAFTQEKFAAAMTEFQDRCSRRYHNFHPPRPKAEPTSDESGSME